MLPLSPGLRMFFVGPVSVAGRSELLFFPKGFMMTRILLGVAALSLVGANIRTDKIPLPKGLQPMQVVAQMDEEGQLLIRQTTTAYVPETRQRTVQKDGRNVTETFTTYVAVYRTVEYRVKGKGFRVFGLDGKAVHRKTLARLL